ncbi:MAG: undecaprenyl/decaprenyl-phosphate alpha-N-acetylglucosaminyl 1-phosphate transferase [Thermoleophilia bacterium]|nr:undecaprenyl/decaprenyl-phosphate alpha-N-acetylglucosaminyl 1-phosphate transferase [Thermoleophilia bacterium]
MSFPESLQSLVTEEAVVWGFLSAAAIVLLLTPVTAWLAPRIGAVDDPRASDRPRVHSRPLPRIGGLAIVVGILVPAAVFIHPDGPYLGILIGTGLVALLGLADDVRRLRPSTKLLGVVAIALIPVVGFDVTFERISFPFASIDFGVFAAPLTVVWIAALANLVNLIDGMDALAAGIVSIAAFSFAVLAASFGRVTPAALAAMTCGATLAFLRHNYHPARIIMGDSGALALGFLLATVAVQGVLKTAATIALVAPLLVVAVPILDTSFVVLKRLKYRRPPWGADHNHFYHRFLRIGFSQRKTAAYLHAWAALLAAWAIMVRFVPPRPRGDWDLGNALLVAAVGLAVVVASAWMVYTLEILKARHLRVLGFGRWATRESEREEAVERVLTAGPR